MTRKGFTLIELLVVVAIIGILATLSVPRLQATRQRATAASMVSDLRNLLTAQENFFVSYQDYAAQIAPAEVPGPGGAGRVALLPSTGNVIIVVRYAPNATNGSGWSAEATNPTISNPKYDTCGVFIGHQSYSPNKAVTAEGAVACY